MVLKCTVATHLLMHSPDVFLQVCSCVAEGLFPHIYRKLGPGAVVLSRKQLRLKAGLGLTLLSDFHIFILHLIYILIGRLIRYSSVMPQIIK